MTKFKDSLAMRPLENKHQQALNQRQLSILMLTSSLFVIVGYTSPRVPPFRSLGPSLSRALRSSVCATSSPVGENLLCPGPSAPSLELIPRSAFIGTEGREDTASPSLPQPAGDLPRALEAQ